MLFAPVTAQGEGYKRGDHHYSGRHVQRPCQRCADAEGERLDEEAQEDLRNNKNFNTYKGAIYENIVGDMLVKAGYQLYFYKNERGTLEIDFMVRDADSLVPIEVKANDSATASLNALIEKEQYSDILSYFYAL